MLDLHLFDVEASTQRSIQQWVLKGIRAGNSAWTEIVVSPFSLQRKVGKILITGDFSFKTL